MRKLVFLVLLIACNTTVKSQNINQKIKSDIIGCYVRHNEILSSDSMEISNDFDAYVTINELITGYHFKNGERKGIYSVSLSITPTSRLLFFFNNKKDYYIITTDSMNVVISRFISYVKKSDNLNKMEVLKYLETITEISKDNFKLKNLNKILPPADSD